MNIGNINGNNYTNNDNDNDICGSFQGGMTAVNNFCNGGIPYYTEGEVITGQSFCGTEVSLEDIAEGVTGCLYSTVQQTFDNLGQPSGCFNDTSIPSEFSCYKSLSSAGSDLFLSQSLCSETGHISQSVGLQLNTDDDDENQSSGYRDYVICNDSNDDSLSELSCNLIGSENSHFGGFCYRPEGEKKIPLKHVCENIDGYTWTNQFNAYDSTFEWVCLNDTDNNPLTSEGVCELLNDQSNYISFDGESIDTIFEGGVDVSMQYTYYTDDGNENSYNRCIIDKEDTSLEELEQICQNYQGHQVGFNFYQNPLSYLGECIDMFGEIILGVSDAESCLSSNKVYINEYDYITNNSCLTLENKPEYSDEMGNLPDSPTTWTGGQIDLQANGIHRSECSASVSSSCNVDCDAGYGGGGEYICEYNSDGADLCEEVNNIAESEIYDSISESSLDVADPYQVLCESYPSCNYIPNQEVQGVDEGQLAGESIGPQDQNERGRCVHDVTKLRDGHLEWIGSECYKLDNTAFAHSTAMLPELDELIAPFIRVIMYVAVSSLLLILILHLFMKKIFKLIGWSVDKSVNTTLIATNKVIDYNTIDNHLIKVFFDSSLTKQERLSFFVLIIGLFVGSIFLFQYMKTSVHKLVDKVWVIIYKSWGIFNKGIYNSILDSFDKLTEQTSDDSSDSQEETSDDGGDDGGDDGDGSQDNNFIQNSMRDARKLSNIFKGIIVIIVIVILILAFSGIYSGFFKDK